MKKNKVTEWVPLTNQTRREGFTLIELLVVIAIVSKYRYKGYVPWQ